jgi:hypothetical protein
MKKPFLITLLLLIAAYAGEAQSTISFTFDDGVTNDMPGYTFEQWNKLLLHHLDSAHIKAVFFVTGFNKRDAKGQSLLKSWNDKGHAIGNHTFSHTNYNSTPFEKFAADVLRTDSLIKKYSHHVNLFRFPYLKEGNTQEKVDQFRAFLHEHHYRNGHVTIDASDWYVDSRLRARLKEDPQADISGFRQFYLEHIFDRALYYDDLAFKLTGRRIHHTLLLHHNLTSALFLGDLINMFKAKGWQVVNALDAYRDPFFNSVPQHIPAGESLVWSMAKESGKYELRYPAEDSQYEKDKMDKLGL